MNPQVRALVFCIALLVAPLFCVIGDRIGGTWGKVGLPLVVIGGTAAYASLAEAPGRPRPQVQQRQKTEG